MIDIIKYNKLESARHTFYLVIDHVKKNCPENLLDKQGFLHGPKQLRKQLQPPIIQK